MTSVKEAFIGNIQHFNVHDGNGFRTTVFFQGCDMRCRWCQNPELQSMTPVLVNNINKKKSEPSARLMSVDEVVAECMKESFFFKYHGGGVTLSGGEPLLNIEFVSELIDRLKENNINVSVETAGYIPYEYVNTIYSKVDTFLYDVKLISAEKRSTWLGIDDTLELENLRKLSLIHNQIVVRVPLIPNVNTNTEEFSKILDFIDELNDIQFVQLLPFHQLGANKYHQIGKEYLMEKHPSIEKERIEWCKAETIARGYIVDVGGKGFTYAQRSD